MARITLTSAPQSIPNSNLGCFFKSDDTFYYGFGTTSPVDSVVGDASVPLDYGGAYGLLWVWNVSPSVVNVCEYFPVVA